MTNHSKDRHVLAAAVRVGAQAVVTLNLRHFPPSATEPYGIVAQSPDDFLVSQFHFAPDTIVDKLVAQAAAIDRTPAEIARTLALIAPRFVSELRAHDPKTFAPVR